MKGKFIVFEGPDGSGKTTQIKLLHRFLLDKGCDVVITREPGGTNISEAVRNILLDPKNSEMVARTEAFLYASARAQHVEELIVPALKAERIVLCDRFVDSTLAYQGYGRNLDIEFLSQLNYLATGGLKPDLTFLLDIPPEKAKNRIRSTRDSEDRIELEAEDFHARVRDGFLEIAQDDRRYKVIDASVEIAEISKLIINEVERILG